MNIYNNKDLKIVKSKGLIKMKPDNPIGYYKLGQTYLSVGNVKDAINSFKESLTADKNYVKSAIGLIASYIYSAKYSNAVKIYNEYKNIINQKLIYKKFLCKMLNKYLLMCKDNEKVSLTNILRYYFGFKKVEETYQTGEKDILTLILLTDGIITGKYKHLKVSKNKVLKQCAKIKWLTEEYRWDIFQQLGENISDKEKNEILNSFNTIPLNCSDTICINSIFERIVYKGQCSVIQKSISNIKDKGILSSTNLWNYINNCQKYANYNIKDIYTSSRILISRGWIDSVVASCIYNIKNNNMMGDLSKEERILKLYGFNNN